MLQSTICSLNDKRLRKECGVKNIWIVNYDISLQYRLKQKAFVLTISAHLIFVPRFARMPKIECHHECRKLNNEITQNAFIFNKLFIKYIYRKWCMDTLYFVTICIDREFNILRDVSRNSCEAIVLRKW